MDALKRITEALLEYETLEAEDLNVLVQGGMLTRERPPPRVVPPPKVEKKEKEKRKILDALDGLPKMEPNKA
jgi:cell division protease FtsH